jgi:murein L,D-transpeptidase YcbB/YkuD
MNRFRVALLAILFLAAGTGVFAFVGSGVVDDEALESSPTLRLEVVLQERTLQVLEDGVVTRVYDVTVGAPRHPTPRGDFRISWMDWNPSWHPPNSPWARGKKPVGPGPDNPMGRVKMFFRNPAYYVHGTALDDQIGRAASHGCVRMLNEDVMELAQLVMEHGGASRPEGWIQRVVDRFRETERVRLSTPVPLTIR